jgi:hypothetical protein
VNVVDLVCSDNFHRETELRKDTLTTAATSPLLLRSRSSVAPEQRVKAVGEIAREHRHTLVEDDAKVSVPGGLRA